MSVLNTKHKFYYKDSRSMNQIKSNSVHLVVTSPPYPMITMWDECFSQMNPAVQKALETENGSLAFELMHMELFRVWKEVYRVLTPGGYACINIGDATRTITKEFRLYPNHSRVLEHFIELGFDVLPEIIWRKPTNSPTKFLGSGMLPCGAYVTLEHEYILVLRKPTKRKFSEDRLLRQQSSYFWEERNKWFSDLWELNGVKQAINGKKIRKRTGAFPLEIPMRLVRMFSAKNDMILDPFAGTATTTLAAIIANRNSVAFEYLTAFKNLHRKEIPDTAFIAAANSTVHDRIAGHIEAMKQLQMKGTSPKYRNSRYDFPVMTKQETEMSFECIESIVPRHRDNSYTVTYRELEGHAHEGMGSMLKSAMARRMPRLASL